MAVRLLLVFNYARSPSSSCLRGVVLGPPENTFGSATRCKG